MKIWLGKRDGCFGIPPDNYRAITMTHEPECCALVVAETSQQAMKLLRKRHSYTAKIGRWQWRELTADTPGIKLLA